MIKLKISIDNDPIVKFRTENPDDLDLIFKKVKHKLGGKKW